MIPRVSVVMPVFNTDRYVAAAIESILSQTFDDFELVIIDDGSTDDSLRIIKKYAERDQRIRFFSRENRGLSRTRNELLAHSLGEYIAPMDSDDIALPDRLKLQVEALGDLPDVVCIGGAYQIMDDAGRLLVKYFAMPETDAEIQKLQLAGHCALHQPCVMFRRSMALMVGGYDESLRYCEDFDLWLRLGEVGRLMNLKQAVLKYRILSTSASAEYREVAERAAREACERAWKRRSIEGKFEATAAWRPGTDSRSKHKFLVMYGWWAFESHERMTAIVYGSRAIRELPMEITGWKLLAAALTKPLPAERR